MTREGTILMVDDDHASLKRLTDILTTEGYAVQPAAGGELALASIEANTPDLVLMEARMPSIDGLEVFRQLRAREETRSVPVIFMSAAAEVSDLVEGLKLGALDFISKPFKTEELLARVASRLELHRTRESLHDSEERLSLFAEQSRTFIWECDSEGLFTYVSPTSLSILGYPPEELVGKKTFYDLHPETGREVFKAAALDVFARGDSFKDLENPVETKEGQWRWVSTSATPMLNTNGEQVGYRGSGIDITAHKKIQEELLLNFETKAALTKLLSLSLHGGTILEFLDQALELILSLKWLSIKSTGAIFLADDDAETLHLETHKGLSEILLSECRSVPFGYCLCGRAAATHAVQFAARLDDRHDIHYDGMQPHGHFCVPMLSSDTVLGVICLYVEEAHAREPWEEDFLKNAANTIGGVVKRLKAENALLASEGRYRRLFEAAKDGILILDAATGKIVDANPFMSELTGFSHKSFLDKHIWEIGPFGDIADSKALFAQLQIEKYVRYRDLPLKTTDGRRVDVEFISNVYLVDQQKVIQCNIRDVTERVRLRTRERLAKDVLESLNRSHNSADRVREILLLIKKAIDIEAVGIRLQEGEDFPYVVHDGFSEEFIAIERTLCSTGPDGTILRDGEGAPALECMCGNILSGRTDPTQPFFTEGGSFWSNNTTALLASTTEEERQGRTRNQCNAEGYESVALIPLRSGEEVIGLLQLNDRRKNRFDLEMIQFFEGLGSSIGVALARQQAGVDLAQSEERFRVLFEQAADCILLLEIDADGMPIIRNANQATFQTLGYRLDELLGQPITFLDADLDANTVNEERRRLVSSGTEAVLEVRHRCKDGTTREFECKVREIKTRSQTFAISVERDVTERKLAEVESEKLREQLRVSQKLESIGTLASGVAHEINNPLNVIMNYGQLILDGTTDPAEVKDYAENIVKESDRVAVIVRNLLSFARQERETYSPAPIADIVERTLSLTGAVLRKDQIAVQCDIPDDLPDVKCRSQQIQQVLMNLLTNARDALNQRYSGASEDKTIRIAASSFLDNADRWVRLTVADHGGGIPPDVADKVFDPFFTTKSRGEGTGLGLSISYGIMNEHGGKLWFESEQGSGTRFHMDFKTALTEV